MKRTKHTCDCFGLPIVATNLKSAVYTVCNHLDKWRGEYITFVNVHALMMATESAEYMDTQKEAMCNFADGKPIAWLQKKRGYIEAGRVAGPDFMEAVLKSSAENGYRHYFYGSSAETLELLVQEIKEKYPDIQIVGYHAPKFVEKIDTEYFDEMYGVDIQRINEATPDFVWIGLGAPKQEEWMLRAKGKVDGIMLGVGAAFDFMSGTKKRAPYILQVLGLEWLYRMMGDPKRLIKRYVTTNYKFMVKLINDKKD